MGELGRMLHLLLDAFRVMRSEGIES